MRKTAFLLILLMTGVYFYAAVGLPAIGDKDSAPNTHVSPRYIEKSYEETASPNMVTATLADYRGYDTLGETTVIFIAGLATFLIINTGSGKKGQKGGSK